MGRRNGMPHSRRRQVESSNGTLRVIQQAYQLAMGHDQEAGRIRVGKDSGSLWKEM